MQEIGGKKNAVGQPGTIEIELDLQFRVVIVDVIQTRRKYAVQNEILWAAKGKIPVEGKAMHVPQG